VGRPTLVGCGPSMETGAVVGADTAAMGARRHRPRMESLTVTEDASGLHAAATASDARGHTVEFRYRWFVDGVRIPG